MVYILSEELYDLINIFNVLENPGEKVKCQSISTADESHNVG